MARAFHRPDLSDLVALAAALGLGGAVFGWAIGVGLPPEPGIRSIEHAPPRFVEAVLPPPEVASGPLGALVPASEAGGVPSAPAISAPETQDSAPTAPRQIPGHRAPEAASAFTPDPGRASFAIAREALDRGALPTADGVRVEDFVNALDYDYLKPERAALAADLEVAPHPRRADRQILRIGLQAAEAPVDQPAHLVFLVHAPDASAAERERVDGLLARAEASLDVEDTAALIDDPSLSLAQGLERAWGTAEAMWAPGIENRVVLIAGGAPRIDGGALDAICARLRDRAAMGITLTAVSLDGAPDLERLAAAGQGSAYRADSEAEVQQIFDRRLPGWGRTVARDVAVRVAFDPEVVETWRLIGYDDRALSGSAFAADWLDGAELGAGQQVTALYEVSLREGAAARSLAEIRIRARRPGVRTPHREWTLASPGAAARVASRDLKMALGAATFAELLRGSPWTAGWTWGRLIQFIDDARRPDRPGDLELLSLVRRARQIAEGRRPSTAARPGGDSQVIAGEPRFGAERALQVAVRRYSGQIRHCYERRLKEDPHLAGALQVGFRVGEGGQVAAVWFEQDTVGDASLAGCVEKKIERWRLPAEAAGVEVVVPFDLSPDRR